MKINMKKILKALTIFGIGATLGHINQVIYDCGVADPEGFNALGKFSTKVSRYWCTCGEAVRRKRKEQYNRVPTPVEEADDE